METQLLTRGSVKTTGDTPERIAYVREIVATQLEPDAGTYFAILFLPKKTLVRVGPRIGPIWLDKGWYGWVGSAQGGVRGRVGHHVRLNIASPVWHLDYVRPALQFRKVWLSYHIDPLRERECQWARLLHKTLGRYPVVRGFGAADCRKAPRDKRLKFLGTDRCEAHFFWSATPFSFTEFSQAIAEAIPEHALIHRLTLDPSERVVVASDGEFPSNRQDSRAWAHHGRWELSR